MTEDNGVRSARQKVETLTIGNIVVDIWETVVNEGNKAYYDASISRKYYSNDEVRYSPNFRQRDFGNLLLALFDARAAIRDYIYDFESKGA